SRQCPRPPSTARSLGWSCTPPAVALTAPPLTVALLPVLGGAPLRKGRELKMRGNGVIDSIPAQEISPKGAAMAAVKVRCSGLSNGRECVRGCSGPQLGQARGAVGFVLLAELLVRLGSAPLFTRALPRRHARGPAHSQPAHGPCTGGCRQRFAGSSPFLGPRWS